MSLTCKPDVSSTTSLPQDHNCFFYLSQCVYSALLMQGERYKCELISSINSDI